LDQPGFKTVDLAIFRDFRFIEKYALEFRVKGTNTFNMVNLSPPSATAPASLATPVRSELYRPRQRAACDSFSLAYVLRSETKRGVVAKFGEVR
jgi:hypothetical protein